MGIKIKYTDPTLNEFSTDDVIINVQSGSLFFKSNTKLFKLQGDDQSTTDISDSLTTTSSNSTLYLSGSTHYTSASVDILLGVAVTGSILPGVHSDGTTGFDLGSPTAAWKDLWLSENSVKFVSSSGEITRFRQEDAKRLREGKPLKQATAIGGTDIFVRAQAIFHETANNHYIKQTVAGLWDFVGPGGNILTIDAQTSHHTASLNGATSLLKVGGSISASGNLTANNINGTINGGNF